MLFLAVVGIIIYIFNSITPMVADDYAYACIFNSGGQRVKSIANIIFSQYRHYFGANGRIVAHFLAQLFLLLGKPFHTVLNSLAFLAFGLLISYHGCGAFSKIKPLPLVFVYFSLFLFTPDFGESFLWVTGSANYLYGPLLTLLFLIPYRKTLAEGELPGATKRGLVGIGSTALAAIGMLLLGLLAGNVNENNGGLAVIVSYGFIIAVLIRHKKLVVWHFTSALGTSVGFLLVLLSPGSQTRLGEGGFMFSQLPLRIRNMSLDIMERFGVLLCILVFLISVLFVYYKREKHLPLLQVLKRLFLPLAYVLLFGLSFYALAVPPWFAYRVWTTFMIFLLIAILCAGTILEQELSFGAPSAKRASACMIAVILLCVALNNYPALKSVNSQSKSRERMIAQAIQEGKTELALPSISSSNRFSCFDPEGDIMPEDTAWQNHVMAAYYGVEKIYAIPDQ